MAFERQVNLKKKKADMLVIYVKLTISCTIYTQLGLKSSELFQPDDLFEGKNMKTVSFDHLLRANCSTMFLKQSDRCSIPSLCYDEHCPLSHCQSSTEKAILPHQKHHYPKAPLLNSMKTSLRHLSKSLLLLRI